MLGKKYFKLNYIVTIVLLVLTLALSFSFTGSNFTTQDGIEESTAAPTTTSGSWTSSSSRYATSFAGGNGTWGMPWQISTAAQLARMSYLVNNSNSSYGSDTFELTANIDLSQYYWSPIGNEDNAFSGSFDGNGYVISGIYTKSADMYQGLFGYMDGGEISNVGIIDSNIQGFSCVGAICAYIYREGSVLNCFNKSTVYGENMQIGGIVGFAYNYRGENITIRNCYNTGSITCSTDDSRGRVGGIIGDLHGSDSYLINCFNTGYVSGSSNVGGVAGYVMQDGGTAVVTNCYNIGQVTGSSNYKGAVVGRNYHDNGTVEYCYWGGSSNNMSYGLGTSSTTGGTNYDNVEKVSNLTTLAKENSWYTNSSNWNSSYSWSMSSTWGIKNSSTNGFNSGYPYLRVFVYNISYNRGSGSAGTYAPTTGYPGDVVRISNATAPTGYTFSGWTATNLETATAKRGSSSGSVTTAWSGTSRTTSQYFINLAGSGDTITFTAGYTAKTTSITLDKNNGSGGSSSVTATYGSAMPTITVPTRTGYTFNGYYINESNNNGTGTKYYNANGRSARNWDIDATTDTLYAGWTKDSFRINYNANGGSVSRDYDDVEYDEDITLPTPTRTGYTFTGWEYGSSTITDMSYTVPDFGASGTEVTFEAQWSRESYTIEYDANGGSVSVASVDVEYRQTITLPTATQTGYTFTGWEYGGSTYTGSYTVPDFGNNGATVTFTAQWSIESYRINYDAGEGSVSPTYDDVSYGNRITLPTPTRTGYTFNGWRYNSTNYTGSYTVPDFGDNGATVTFTAQWTKERYTINYNADGGNVSPSSQTVNFGDSITLPTPTKAGYTFTGWRYNNSTITDMDYIVPDFGNNGASVTFIAQWTADKYTITFDEVGGSEVSDIVDYTIESTISFPSTTKAGYDFVNWQVTRADGNWTNGASFNANTTTTDKYGNVTLTAQWDYHTYTVTLNPNGGEVSPTSIRVTYQSTYGSLPTPTRDGYVFKGWYTSETSGTQILSTTKYTSTQDTTIFAQWQDTWANHASDTLTEQDGYYLISSEEELAQVSYLFNCTDRTDVQTMKFKLTKNLDMSDYTWLPIGTQSRQFRGTFEGNGYIISGLNTYYNSSISSTYTNIGLFGYVNGATIQNLYLRDTDMRGGSNVGGLIGYATGNTQVTSCAFDGDITANSNGGSIVGLGATSVIVSNCTVFSSNTTANTNGMARGCSVRSLVYITNDTKGYIGTDFSNYVFVEGMPAPVPTGLSWLAQGGEPCDNTKLDSWANGD